MTYNIMRLIEIDAGHRVPFHNSKCRNLHGHRYRIEVELTSASVVPVKDDQSESGMVMDFGLIKQILTESIHDKYDHGLILYDRDPLLTDLGFAAAMAHINQKLIKIPVIPTAEQLAWYWGTEFYTAWNAALVAHHLDLGIAMKRFRVWETPNSYADFE